MGRSFHNDEGGIFWSVIDKPLIFLLSPNFELLLSLGSFLPCLNVKVGIISLARSLNTHTHTPIHKTNTGTAANKDAQSSRRRRTSNETPQPFDGGLHALASKQAKGTQAKVQQERQ
jgi:hypothetical protein